MNMAPVGEATVTTVSPSSASVEPLMITTNTFSGSTYRVQTTADNNGFISKLFDGFLFMKYEELYQDIYSDNISMDTISCLNTFEFPPSQATPFQAILASPTRALSSWRGCSGQRQYQHRHKSTSQEYNHPDPPQVSEVSAPLPRILSL